MADEPEIIPRTLLQKLLFYTTAFFILLGTFSLFAFLFLVPFVIDPAFTTIFMQFDTNPAMCVTVDTVSFRGASNCSWSSCREGCTKELFECLQIRVNYKLGPSLNGTDNATNTLLQDPLYSRNFANSQKKYDLEAKRPKRAIRDYDYDVENYYVDSLTRLAKIASEQEDDNDPSPGFTYNDETLLDVVQYSDSDHLYENENHSEWYFTNARLFPNVKGCGYPPSLNCSIWTKQYKIVGTNFSCFYSKVDPGLVISDLDMWQNTLNLVYSMAIPIPSFIISVIYLTFAYFKIYNEDEESAPLDKNAEEMADDDEVGCEEGVGGDELDLKPGDLDDFGIEIGDDEVCIVLESCSLLDEEIPSANGMIHISNSNSSELPSSFGQQMIKAQMADALSRESTTDNGLITNSGSIPG